MQNENFKEIYNQINELLKTKYTNQEDRDKIISDMGELIISETFLELLESVTDVNIREKLVEALNVGNQEDILSMTESQNIDMFSILEKKSKQILEEAVK